jgi:hypothetical protein
MLLLQHAALCLPSNSSSLGCARTVELVGYLQCAPVSQDVLWPVQRKRHGQFPCHCLIVEPRALLLLLLLLSFAAGTTNNSVYVNDIESQKHCLARQQPRDSAADCHTLPLSFAASLQAPTILACMCATLSSSTAWHGNNHVTVHLYATTYHRLALHCCRHQ